MKYDFIAIEERWQNHWAQHRTFATPNPSQPGFDPSKPKYYVLDMFPYPSGIGLHVGHPLGYIATDIVARYKRMKGFNVLHPMGYDAFGLPAEQFAVEQGVHPRVTTERNIANMTVQLKRLGLSYDWDRSLATTDPGYYRWTQWIFLQLYNSWYNPIKNKAEPIAHLLAELQSGRWCVWPDGQLDFSTASGALEAVSGLPIGVRKWYELSPHEQADFLDDYRLAYIAQAPVNWCPALGTVLANEEVTNDGRSERGNFPVYQRPLKQWMLRITAYANRLEADLDFVDWPEPIKQMQRNWIGRSTGAVVEFAIDDPDDPNADPETISVFTTRPDTLFGASYLVLAPDHPLVEAVTTPAHERTVGTYRAQAQAASQDQTDRQAPSKTKTGVFTGAFAINPASGNKIPIWVADYVMMSYGTGAIMAVPAHDQRDHDFATTFNLPIIPVVEGGGDCRDQAWEGPGQAINSANPEISLNGLPTPQAKEKITAWLQSKNLGHPKVNYKLRDWLFSRQRYWGEPFPILHAPDGQILPLDEAQLPVDLPEMSDFRPAASDDPNAPPQPPLARAPDSWKFLETNDLRLTREFNTMPQWAGSCWYYLRFLDPHNADRFVGRDPEQYWMLPTNKNAGPQSGGVDLYVGGVEHAVLHLLYARFWHKVLYDLGQVSTPEPFARLYNQGYIQAFAYVDSRGIYVPADQVQEKDGKFFYQDQEVRQEFGKMGKSLKNAIAPDDICNEYGCDTLRLYEMYLGPLDQSKVWRTHDIVGVHRFLQRLWRNFIDPDTGRLLVVNEPPPETLLRLLHKTIKRVTDAMDSLSFNVAIAALIELNNELVSRDHIEQAIAQPMILCLAPLAPHVAEELWSKLGHQHSLALEPWPNYDPAMLVEDQIEYPVQINGKLRSKITVPADADEQFLQSAAQNDPKIQPLLQGKTIRKFIVIKARMINIIVG